MMPRVGGSNLSPSSFLVFLLFSRRTVNLQSEPARRGEHAGAAAQERREEEEEEEEPAGRSGMKNIKRKKTVRLK